MQLDHRDLLDQQGREVRGHRVLAALLEQVVHRVRPDPQGRLGLLVQLDLQDLRVRQEQELLVLLDRAALQAIQGPVVLVDRLVPGELPVHQVLVDQVDLLAQVLQGPLVLLDPPVLQVLPELDRQVLQVLAVPLVHRAHPGLEVLDQVVLAAQVAQVVHLDPQVQVERLDQAGLPHLQ